MQIIPFRGNRMALSPRWVCWIIGSNKWILKFSSLLADWEIDNVEPFQGQVYRFATRKMASKQQKSQILNLSSKQSQPVVTLVVKCHKFIPRFWIWISNENNVIISIKCKWTDGVARNVRRSGMKAIDLRQTPGGLQPIRSIHMKAFPQTLTIFGSLKRHPTPSAMRMHF